MQNRKVEIQRKTNETNISLKLNIDGTGEFSNNAGCGFLNHMLDLFAKHGRFDLFVCCDGDVDVDYHHSVEDIAIVLGEAFKTGLGDKKGIYRYGNFYLPMDEALILVALDISGRSNLEYDVNFKTEKIGDFDTELVKEFFLGFSRALGLTLHIKQFSGENSHHIAEAIFKGIGRSLKEAVKIDEKYINEIPSTKGVL